MTPSVQLLSVTALAGYGEGYIADEGTIGMDGLRLIEYAGRVDYHSQAKLGQKDDIIPRWIASGHESMIEMVDVAFLITCSRVVSHELVRHRIASYQQESQRYVNYAVEDEDDLFYIPEEWVGNEVVELMFREAYARAYELYHCLLAAGVPKQMARYVLPNATRTRIVMKANLREWRHFLKLRMHKSAQPEMQAIARLIFAELNGLYEPVFGDIPGWLGEGERAAR